MIRREGKAGVRLHLALGRDADGAAPRLATRPAVDRRPASAGDDDRSWASRGQRQR